MKDFKGTPGPWYVSNEGYMKVRAQDGDEVICQYSHISSWDFKHRNMNLIAAAPELLEIVIHVRNCVENDGSYEPANIEYFNKVITKALGETK